MKLFADLDDNQYWMCLWSFGFVTVMSITTAISIDNWHEDKLKHDLVVAGKDPLELACLFDDSTNVEMPCFVLAQEKAKTYVSK